MLGIEFIHEFVQARLLLQDVGARWAGRFLLQCQMHALVSAVLLRMARLEVLDDDAEPEPPDGEAREIVEPVRTGERNAAVAPDPQGQAAFLEQPPNVSTWSARTLGVLTDLKSSLEMIRK